MTWQRIDENTYIDDTLVTCAEYQLFIDEMREQGKYYQPDHWMSYQFPKGKAREPILGVRRSDAIAFCEWLTRQEGEPRHYRLPIDIEVLQYPLRESDYQEIGYWLTYKIDEIHHIDETLFSWVSAVPDDLRAIGRAPSLEKVDVNSTPLVGAIARANIRPLDLDYPGRLHLEIEINKSVDNDIFTLVKRILTNEQDLLLGINRLRNRIINSASNTDIAYAYKLTIERARDLLLALELNNNREVGVKIQQRVRKFSDYVISQMLTSKNAIDPELNIVLGSAITQTFDFLIDMVTLQERISGRSPAFEGIRLVKERIK